MGSLTRTCKKVEVNSVCLSVQHWSSRKGWDRRRSLWGGYAVISPDARFWFAGDTGYCPGEQMRTFPQTQVSLQPWRRGLQSSG